MRRSSLLFAFGSAVTLVASTFIGGCGDDEETTTSVGPTTTTGTTTSTTDATVTVGTTTTTTTTTTGGSGGIGGSEGGAGGSIGGSGGMGGLSMGGAGGVPTGGAGGTSMGGASMGGAGGGMLPASEAAFFRGDFATNGVEQVGSAVYPGPVVTTFSLDTLMTGDDITSVAVSPDGMTIAVSGRDTSTSLYVINLYNANGMGTATNLVTGANASVDIESLAFSPDGQWIAYRTDATVSGANELWVVPAAGGTAKRVSPSFTSDLNDVGNYAWQPDVSGNLKYIAYSADPVDGIFSLFTVEITATTPTPVNVVPEATTTQNVLARVPQFDSLGRVYFVTDFLVDGLFQLYQADIDGMNRVQVPGSILMNGSGEADIGAIGMSPDGTTIAFSAEAPTVGLYDFYVLDLATTTPVDVSNVPMTVVTSVFPIPISWSPDGTMLAVVSDFPVNADASPGDLSAFILPTSGNPGGVRVLKVPQGMNQDIDQIAFTANSARLFMRGDPIVNNDTALFSTADFTTADQNPTPLLVQGVPTGGDIADMQIAP